MEIHNHAFGLCHNSLKFHKFFSDFEYLASIFQRLANDSEASQPRTGPRTEKYLYDDRSLELSEPGRDADAEFHREKPRSVLMLQNESPQQIGIFG